MYMQLTIDSDDKEQPNFVTGWEKDA